MTDEELTALVDQLRRDRRRHPCSGRWEYSQAARSLAEAGERLIVSGEAARAVPVLRKAADRMTRALMYMDDSSGIVGNDLQEIVKLYARACAAAPPKPAALAGWLVGLAFDGPGWPRVLLHDFTEALGSRGVAEVARLVSARAQTADPGSWAALVAVRDLREQLAEISGEVDRHVAVLAEHLTNAAQYERITQVLRDADRPAEAIAWARRGLVDKAGSPHTERLRDTLVDLLVAGGDAEGAVQVRRAAFQQNPTVVAYRALAATDREDPASWALPILEERVLQQPVYAGELVEVLMLLGCDDEAWEVGRGHQLGHNLWLRLLDRRRTTHSAVSGNDRGAHPELQRHAALSAGERAAAGAARRLEGGR